MGNIVTASNSGAASTIAALRLTSPHDRTASGAKMARPPPSRRLNADRLSPYDYWQYFRNTDDADVGRFLRLFTDLPLAEIARLEAVRGAEINDAQRSCWRTETTTLATRRRPRRRRRDRTPHLRRGQHRRRPADARLAAGRMRARHSAFQLFTRSGLAASNGEARRLIKGAAPGSTARRRDETRLVTLADVDAQASSKLSAGKKRHAVVRPT